MEFPLLSWYLNTSYCSLFLFLLPLFTSYFSVELEPGSNDEPTVFLAVDHWCGSLLKWYRKWLHQYNNLIVEESNEQCSKTNPASDATNETWFLNKKQVFPDLHIFIIFTLCSERKMRCSIFQFIAKPTTIYGLDRLQLYKTCYIYGKNEECSIVETG